MIVLFSYRKIRNILIVILIIFMFSLTASYVLNAENASASIKDSETLEFLKTEFDQILRIRNRAILERDISLLETFYNKKIRNSLWAYEHEANKMKYLEEWAYKQCVEFKSIKSDFVIKSAKYKGEGYSLVVVVSTEYAYSYIHTQDVLNTFRVGAYHYIDLVPYGEAWHITKEWYGDPASDTIGIKEDKIEEIRKIISQGEQRDLSDLNPRRVKAVEYADKYCGTANKPEQGFIYNPDYKNFNPEGGDCANYASQILHEGGGFRKNSVWNYVNGAGSKAWLNANGFNNYMIYNGRASVISHGTYEKIVKSSFKLLPGDYVAYEKKGKVVHISVVTGLDSNGYALVNSHNADRYRVPWDMGWNREGITFWLVRVHY